jgi:NAD(P)-dependent dehydrogenase (short-subunit alcohol dehydrogenase family)
MPSSTAHEAAGTVLLVGASRGLGHAMAAVFLKKGWNVIGTVRGRGRTALHETAEAYGDRLEIEQLDITETDQIAALHARLSGRRFDILFVNAGTVNADRNGTVAEIA